MKINKVDRTPYNVELFDGEYPKDRSKLAEDVVEIFETPLTGSYNWIIQYRIIVFVNCMNSVKN